VIVDEQEAHKTYIDRGRKNLNVALFVRMRISTWATLGVASAGRCGVPDLAPAGWAAPGVALAGTAAGAVVGDACAGSPALPSCGLALTLAGAALWVPAVPRERRDRLAFSIGAALAVLAMAALQQLLACMLGRTTLPPAELLRAGGLGLLIVALVIELDRRRSARAASAAVARERRRLARELHDGLAQELAYLQAQSRRITGAETLVEGADRALDECRAAISGLVRSCDEPLERSLEATAVSVGERHGVDVVCDLSGGLEVDDVTREALLRVLREAIANASRHGGARLVRVELRRGPALSVTDDGRGFAPAAAVRPDAHGLASMRERVEALGGTFSLSSHPQAGTRVEVALG
jgi:signal transduction histidine kinase